MTLHECLASLEISSPEPDLGIEWEKSAASFPETIPFLSKEFLQTTAKKYFEDDWITQALLEAAVRIQRNTAAVRLMWHQHYLVVQNYERYWLKCYRFPELPILGRDARAFYLILALSGVHHFGDVHGKLGISWSQLQPTIQEIRASIAGSVDRKGLIGVAPHYSGWWQGFFSGRLYRLGRLTFLKEQYTWPFHIFANQDANIVGVLPSDGLNFNTKGLIQLSGEALGWRARYKETDQSVSGYSIQIDGYAVKDPVEWAREDWRELVKLGDPTISVHISPGSKMGLKACIDSFAEAKTFFHKYFPEVPFRLFTCDTWLLDPQLKTFLKPDANIIQFQKRFYLVPSPVDAEFVPIRTIFGAEALTQGFQSVIPKTALQKGAADFKRAGGVLRHGYGFLPWEATWAGETH